MTSTTATDLRRGFPFGRLLLGMLAGIVLVLAFGTGALFAYQGRYAERIYPGVTVDGVDVAGLTPEAARARLERDLARYGQGVAVIVLDGSRVEIPYAALGRRADVDVLVELAWSVGRSQEDPLARAAQGVRTLLDGTRIGPRVVVDEGAVRVQVLSAAGRLDRAPTSGSAAVTKKGFTTVPAVPGRGLPRQDVAAALLDRLADPAAPDRLELAFDAVPVEPAVTNEEVATAVLAATRIARDLRMTHGKQTWTFKAATVRGWIDFAATEDGAYAPTVPKTAARKALTSLARRIDREPKDATFLVGRGGGRVGVVAGRNGLALDVNASAALIATALVARAATVSSDPPPPASLAVKVVKPKLSTEEAKKAAPLMQRLSSWTTVYEVSERNGFGNNISIPTRDINGYVLRPGAVFDFWSALGPITYARGYRDGGAILNGRTEPTGAFAGGICSCSTTLFNAAARAGLQILERDNHYYYIARYPMGLDATVWISGGARRSMRFRNDTKFPLLIRGFASPGRVTFEIWGPPTGRRVTFSAPTIRNVVRAIDTVQYTTSLRPGQTKRIEYPDNGMQVWVTRWVRDASGKIIHRDTWYSDYKRVNGILLVGRAAAPAASPSPSPAP